MLQLRITAEPTGSSVNVVLKLDLQALSQYSSRTTLGAPIRNETNDRFVELLREHPYLPRFPLSDIRATPYALPTGFQWSNCDLTDERTCDEILSLFMVRTIRPHDMYNDSKEYLRWSLCPPGYFPEWHVGVRKYLHNKLVGFVSAVPARIRVRDVVFPMAVLRHLHVRVVEEGTIPQTVLFSEILRWVNLKGVWQQVYGWESFLPEPIAVSGLWERRLDLCEIGDLHYQTPTPGMSIEQISRSCRLQDFIGRLGIRKMRPSDVTAVTVLLRKYLSQFVVAPVFSEADVNHWLVPQEDVLDSFVIEKTVGEITDFFSYTRLQSRRGREFPLAVARLFYYATAGTNTTSLSQLIRDALLTAKYNHCCLFVVDDFMNNDTFLEELRFERSGGNVRYNLNNYPMDVLRSSDIGLSIL